VLAERCDVLVIVDVLSFTTSLSIAVAGAATVWPHPWRDGAEELARELGAAVVRGRSTAEGLTLSPASLVGLEPGMRLVMPSPNGSVIAHSAVQSAIPMVAGSLRNASAVAAYLSGYSRIGLVPAGERWSDDSLRPAYEDLVGAGAVAARLGGVLSPDAQAAALAYSALRPLAECPSGAELVQRGFAEDVRLASEIDADVVVPVLRDGKFVAA
jgi:2-phosphosulfolactate phosphatase